MDRKKLRNKVFLDLLSSPWTLGPTVLGATSLLASWATEMGPGWLTLAGIGGVLAGVGSLATQWIFRSDEIIRRAYEDLEAQEMAAHENRLDDLHNRLRKDKDPRDEDSLRELRMLYRSFKQDNQWRGRLSPQSSVEIASMVEKLYKGCIMSLERSADLVEAARKMNRSKAKTGVLEAREKLLTEVFESVEQLAKTIEHVKTLRSDDGASDLARIRRELDESLEVARRVEERMQSMEEELSGGERPALRE
jgi:hypothetical protein